MSEPSAVRPAATTTEATDGPLPARLDPATAPAFSRYRIMAFVTGGFLLLLVLEMTLKYVFHAAGVDETGAPRAVLGTWIAIVHGWIYVIYAVTCLQLWSKARWGLGRLAVMILGGVIPALSFVVEARASHWPSLARRR